jgi:hypothetical protein
VEGGKTKILSGDRIIGWGATTFTEEEEPPEKGRVHALKMIVYTRPDYLLSEFKHEKS